MRTKSTLYSALLCFTLALVSQVASAQHVAVRFEQLPPVPVGGKMFGFAKADFNHDGKLDVVAATQDTSQIAVFLGIGDGTFQAPILTPVTLGPLPIQIVTADVNSDGNPDVIIVDCNAETVDVLLGNGDGTFQTGKISPTGNNPLAVAAADLDGDGHIDLFVGGNGGSLVLFGVGDGTFLSKPSPQYFGSSFA